MKIEKRGAKISFEVERAADEQIAVRVFVTRIDGLPRGFKVPLDDRFGPRYMEPGSTLAIELPIEVTVTS